VGLVEKELLSLRNKIAVISQIVPHKTEGEFMCPGKISVLSLLVPHKTEGEFMCSA
jgi:hypothetical protein